MSWVDVVIIIMVLSSVLAGLLRGLIVEVGGIVGAVGGLFLARHEYRTAEDFLAFFFHKDAHLAMVAFVLVFVIVAALVTIIATVVRTVVRFTPLGLIDRLGGAILGLALGVLTAEVLVLVAAGVHDASLRSALHHSTLAPILKHAVPGLHSLVPSRLPGTAILSGLTK